MQLLLQLLNPVFVLLLGLHALEGLPLFFLYLQQALFLLLQILQLSPQVFQLIFFRKQVPVVVDGLQLALDAMDPVL